MKSFNTHLVVQRAEPTYTSGSEAPPRSAACGHEQRDAEVALRALLSPPDLTIDLKTPQNTRIKHEGVSRPCPSRRGSVLPFGLSGPKAQKIRNSELRWAKVCFRSGIRKELILLTSFSSSLLQSSRENMQKKTQKEGVNIRTTKLHVRPLPPQAWPRQPAPSHRQLRRAPRGSEHGQFCKHPEQISQNQASCWMLTAGKPARILPQQPSSSSVSKEDEPRCSGLAVPDTWRASGNILAPKWKLHEWKQRFQARFCSDSMEKNGYFPI